MSENFNDKPPEVLIAPIGVRSNGTYYVDDVGEYATTEEADREFPNVMECGAADYQVWGYYKLVKLGELTLTPKITKLEN